MNESDRELLIRIDERVERIFEKLEQGNKQFKNHENRLDRLEAWRNKLLGAFGVLTIMITILYLVK